MDIKYVIRIPSPTTVNSAQLDLKNGTSQLADCFDFAFLPLFCFECALHRFNSSSRSAGSNRIGRLVFVAYDGVLTAFPSLFNTVNRDGNRIQIGQCYLSTNFGRSVSMPFFHLASLHCPPTQWICRRNESHSARQTWTVDNRIEGYSSAINGDADLCESKKRTFPSETPFANRIQMSHSD